MELLFALALCVIGVLCLALAVSAKELSQTKHRLYHLHSMYELERLRADTLSNLLRLHSQPTSDKE